MDLKPGKVAICLSGLVRTGMLAKPSFDKFFGHLDYDLFFHTWETDCPEGLVELYKPKKYIIQQPLEKQSNGSFGDMMYSIMMANKLKREQEIENDSRYGLVIKTRFDLIFPEQQQFMYGKMSPRTIYCSGGNDGVNSTDYEHHGINDVIFWGDSQSMDIACDTYMYYKHIALHEDRLRCVGIKLDPGNIYYSTGNMITDLCSKSNVHSVFFNNCGEVPWRTDVSHLDPFKDYELIRERYQRV